jgi:hypothetical protein
MTHPPKRKLEVNRLPKHSTNVTETRNDEGHMPH